MARTTPDSGRLIPNLVPIWGHHEGPHGHPRLYFNVCIKIVIGLVVSNIIAFCSALVAWEPFWRA